MKGALLTVSETAEQLFGENTQSKRRIVKRLIEDGQLKALPHRSSYYVPTGEIQKLRGDHVGV